MGISFQSALNYFLSIAPLRTNRFSFEMTGFDPLLGIQIDTIDIPTIAISTTPFQINNTPQIMIPYGINYDANTISITCKEQESIEGQSVYTTMLEIIESIIPDRTKLKFYDDIITKQCVIKFLGIDDTTEFKSFTMNNVYPVSVKLSPGDMNSTNSYVTSTTILCFESCFLT